MAALISIGCDSPADQSDTTSIPTIKNAASKNAKNHPGTDLTLRFLLRGPAPTPQPMQLGDDVVYCGDPSMVDENLIVDPRTHGVQNVIAVLESPHQPAPSDLPAAKIVCQGCRFDPHVTLIRSGQTVELVNEDVLGHIVQVGFFANPFVATAIPIQHSHAIEVALPEPSPAKIGCQQFPWMNAHLMVVDHGHAGISDSAGQVKFTDLPTGVPLTFRLWHESAKFDPQTVKRGRITLTLPPAKSPDRESAERTIELLL